MLKIEGFKLDLNLLLNPSEGLGGVTVPGGPWAPPNGGLTSSPRRGSAWDLPCS